MLTIKLQRSYKKLNSKSQLVTVFVYGVSGSDEQLKSYHDAQGEHYREDDDKHPVWFSTKFVGTSGKLIITSNGKCVPDTSQMDQAASLSQQYGGNFGQAIANAYAAQIVGLTTVAAPIQPVAVTQDDKFD